jgi:hypothetical protein
MKPDTTAPSLAMSRPSPADRRRTRRYQVELSGTMQDASGVYPVVISDVSLEGALISAGPALSSGAPLVLTIDGFGTIDAHVVYAGKDFCGIQFFDAHLHRDRLAAWLGAEVGST